MTSRVLIVDDHADFRRLARALLEPEGVEILGEAGRGRDALAMVAALRPDAVLLDVQLPDLDGFAVCRAIRAAWPAVRVVLCSVRPTAAYGPRYAECGAHAFAAKDELTGPAVALMLGPGGPAST
ncbi:response regulator [Dactylosporangium matsuzakiense]|uniref:Response regulator n=1 Tax=Dactylosporangium matsuzakiense TaxID=53360 RepID=A0A9W6KUF4_9ACTN|nr:response regulator [Dactylosporangium matsuzakiense]UWZ41286.1 response regulator [Dactylosporangium matsuzakiense]GLL05664.1 response regulator [Dactylosporangium matsuzakiense]